jgi:hypothetical protein
MLLNEIVKNNAIKMQAVKHVFSNFQANAQIDTASFFGKMKVVDITFINQGTAPVRLNKNLTLTTDKSLQIECNFPYVDCTTYEIVFGAGTRYLVVIAKCIDLNPNK